MNQYMRWIVRICGILMACCCLILIALPASGSSAYGLLINGDFKLDANQDRIPDFWKTGSLTPNDGLSCTPQLACMFTFLHDDQNRWIYQPIYEFVPAGTELRLQASITAKYIPEGSYLAVKGFYNGTPQVMHRIPIAPGRYASTLYSDQWQVDQPLNYLNVIVYYSGSAIQNSRMSVRNVSLTNLAP